MEMLICGPDGRQHQLTNEPLHIRYAARADLVSAVAAGHDKLTADHHADALYVRTFRYRIAVDDSIVGFQILEFSAFDPGAGNLDLLYTPRFDAPDLGLIDASAGVIIETAQKRFL